jgi:hypothetical protein
MATNSPLIVIIYDSVNNPVFESQVLAPVVQAAHTSPQKKYVLVSLERTAISPDHPVFTRWPGPVHIIRNYLPFIGQLTLQCLLPAVKKAIRTYSTYEIRARGPHASWLALHAANKNCTHITLQARGLLAAEYEYVHRDEQRRLWKYIHAVRARWYTALEQATYSKSTTIPTVIEAVSPALQEYLTTTYHPTAKIIIAQEDLPPKLSDSDRLFWRTKLRNDLSLPETSIVYCYSGSAKPWQCPDKTIAYFAQQLKKDNNAYLLLLTQDVDAFTTHLIRYQIPAHHIRIISISAAQVINYLAAADKGIVLRDAALMNWVSRPTKALEYQAAGLEVVHNNTIAWLTKDNAQTNTISIQK